MDYINKIFNTDCIAGMNIYPDHSIDMILCDLPYGITDCRWDSIIPFTDLWRQYLRIVKDNGAIVLTAAQPFTTKLISSQPKLFRYCWYWHKNMTTGFTFAKHQPLRCMEDVCVFYKHAPIYNPQGIIVLDKPIKNKGKHPPEHGDSIYRMDGSLAHDTETCIVHYPQQLLEVKCERGLHPTQKPVALFEYFIRTYTNSGELVMDNCMGSGTTAIACIQSGRNFTGFEIDEGYYKIASDRINAVLQKCSASKMKRYFIGSDIMSDRKHPRYRPAMDNRTWGIICRDVDKYYKRRKRLRGGEDESGKAPEIQNCRRITKQN